MKSEQTFFGILCAQGLYILIDCQAITPTEIFLENLAAARVTRKLSVYSLRKQYIFDTAKLLGFCAAL